MTAESALIVSLALLFIALLLSRKPHVERLPKLEQAWFHLSITWPVAVKAALGSFIFSAASDEGTNYALVTYGPAAIAAVALLFQRLRGDAKFFAPGVIVFSLLVFTIPFVLDSGSGIIGFLPLMLALPVVVRRAIPLPLASWFAQARASLVILAVALTFTALTARSNVIGLCRLDKCSAFGEVLTSPITNNGNFAGVAIAIILPLALLGLRKFPMILVAASAMILIELSGSRSASIAAWAVVAVVVLASGNWAKRAWLAWLAFIGALMASVVTAVGEFPADFATWRGSLWARAQEIFSESPVAGHGPGYWVQQPQESGFIANYSPHNIWLEIAISGGAIALLGAVIAGVTLLRGVSKQERYAFVLSLTALLALGILEAPVQAGRIGLAPFAHLLPLMIAASCTAATGGRRPRNSALPRLADRDPALH